jgi:hypothetical protein
MATSTLLSNPHVLINSVNMSDQCTAANFSIDYAQLTATAFGDVDNKYVKGLGDHSVTLSFYGSFAATETWATLNGLVGTTTTIIVSPEAPATPGTYSATNPGMTLTGTFLASLPVNFALGELNTMDVVFTGGVYTLDVS